MGRHGLAQKMRGIGGEKDGAGKVRFENVYQLIIFPHTKKDSRFSEPRSTVL